MGVGGESVGLGGLRRAGCEGPGEPLGGGARTGGHSSRPSTLWSPPLSQTLLTAAAQRDVLVGEHQRRATVDVIRRANARPLARGVGAANVYPGGIEEDTVTPHEDGSGDWKVEKRWFQPPPHRFCTSVEAFHHLAEEKNSLWTEEMQKNAPVMIGFV
jgi:hypothetical protein